MVVDELRTGSCEPFRAQMLRRRDGLLAARERADFEAHVAACPDCRAELDSLDAFEDLYRSPGQSGFDPLGDYRARFDRACDAAEANPLRRARVTLLRRPTWAIAAALLLSVFAFLPSVLDDHQPPALDSRAAWVIDGARGGGGAVRVGDAAFLRLTMPATGYLYVVDIDAERDTTWLLPMAGAAADMRFLGYTDHRFDAGRKLSLPAPEAGALTLDGLPDRPRLLFVMTAETSIDDSALSDLERRLDALLARSAELSSARGEIVELFESTFAHVEVIEYQLAPR